MTPWIGRRQWRRRHLRLAVGVEVAVVAAVQAGNRRDQCVAGSAARRDTLSGTALSQKTEYRLAWRRDTRSCYSGVSPYR